FATVRLRTAKMRNCGSRDTTLAMVFKLLETAQKRWNRLHGFALLTLVVNNVKFQDGIQVEETSARGAAYLCTPDLTIALFSSSSPPLRYHCANAKHNKLYLLFGEDFHNSCLDFANTVLLFPVLLELNYRNFY